MSNNKNSTKKSNVILFNYVHPNEGKPFVSTKDLWKGFGYKEHRYLKWVIEKHEKEFIERGILATVEASNSKKGQPEKSYLLNERQFVLLCLLVKNTPESVKIKSAIESEFNRLRKITIQEGRKEALQYKRDTAKPMTDMLVYIREGLGKETKGIPHCSNEMKLTNWALTGYYAPLDESSLDAYDAKLLGAIRQHNTLLMTRFIKQPDRKPLLTKFVDEYRAKNPKQDLIQETPAQYRVELN